MAERQTLGTIVRRLLILIMLAMTFTASAMVTIYALFQSGEVKVPNTVGMTEDDAKRAIERAGLDVKVRRVHFDSEIAAGKVTEQDPVAGFPVKSGFEIKIDVSKGPDPNGETEEPPPPGPTNPVDGPNANDNKKKRDDKNKNANDNANANKNANTNKNAADNKNANKNDNKAKNENKNTDGKGVKTDEPGAVKPKPADSKPKPPKPETDTPPKPKPKPAPPKVPPHD